MELIVKEDKFFFDLKCVSGECEKCSMKHLFDINDFMIPGNVKYDQFVRSEYTYLLSLRKSLMINVFLI